MKPRAARLALLLLFSITASFCWAADADRKHVVLDESAKRKTFPFSDAVVVGNTLYLAGTVGFDQSGKVPPTAEEEAKLAMDAVKQVLESQSLSIDDLVSVQVYCTDFTLYDRFNAVYRTYFHEQFPARAFLGVSSLIRGAHFEITGIAVKRPKNP
jgi:2-iminobutanoate/2-iminopropanoate deaminase